MSERTRGRVELHRMAFNSLSVVTAERHKDYPDIAAKVICSFPKAMTQSETEEIRTNAAFVVECFNIADAVATPFSMALRITELEIALANALQAAERLKDQQAMPDDSMYPVLDFAAETLARKWKS